MPRFPVCNEHSLCWRKKGMTLKSKLNRTHRRTSQGLGGCSPAPHTRAKPLFFGQKLDFSGRSQQPKMKKIVFIKQKNGIHSV